MYKRQSFWYIVCRAHTIELPNGHHEAMKTADGSADILGLIYMGGFIVPILLTMLFTVIAVSYTHLDVYKRQRHIMEVSLRLHLPIQKPIKRQRKPWK